MTNVLHVSALDIGSNTVKVSHARCPEDGEPEYLQHVSETIRLGHGIEQTGMVEDARIEACVRFLQQEEWRGREYGSTSFIGVATEALRVASNGSVLLDRIRRETSWEVRVISGDEEARLTFEGLKSLIPDGESAAIVDIGGGSTEFIQAEHGQETFQVSVPVGSGRLADRYFTTDPPGSDATERARQDAIEAFREFGRFAGTVQSVMLSGGSGLFMARLIEQLFPDRTMGQETIRDLMAHLSGVPAEDTMSRIDIPLPRAKVLPASVAIALAMLETLEVEPASGVPSGIRMGLISDFLAANTKNAGAV